MATPKTRGKKKESTQAELARAMISQDSIQFIESNADYYFSQLLKSGLQDKPPADLMMRFYKFVQSNTDRFDQLRPESLTCDAGVGKFCHQLMYNRQRNLQRSVEKDQLKSGRSPKKEDAEILFAKQEETDSDDGKSGKSDLSDPEDEAYLANEPAVDGE